MLYNPTDGAHRHGVQQQEHDFDYMISLDHIEKHSQIALIPKPERKVTGKLERSSEVKGTFCSFRGPEFCSQHPQGGSQPPTISAPRDLMCSSVLFQHRTHVHIPSHIHIHEKKKAREF